MNPIGKKILVTGSSGFIGTNLVNRLKSVGAIVKSFDKSEGFNIKNKSQINSEIKKNYDAIYHLAALSGSQNSLKSIESNLRTNAIVTMQILEAIVKYSPKTKIILSSSRLEYGTPIYLPVDEKHPTLPTSPYGLSKLISSQATQMYSRLYGLKYTIFRTSNVYGPHKKSKFSGYNVINYFIDLAQGNSKINIFGSGEQKRDYIFIDDLIDAFLLALSDKSNQKIYNLGYGKGLSLVKMARLVIKVAGKGKIHKVDWPDDWKGIETGDYITNIKKIKKELKFEPTVFFADGIRKTIK